MVNSMFDYAKTAFDLALYLTGTLALWSGLMKIAEVGGMVKVVAKIVNPFFHQLFPSIQRTILLWGLLC